MRRRMYLEGSPVVAEEIAGKAVGERKEKEEARRGAGLGRKGGTFLRRLKADGGCGGDRKESLAQPLAPARGAASRVSPSLSRRRRP